MKRPSKTAAELEASIKLELDCDWPTEMAISVQPDGDSWKVQVLQEGSGDDADRREMIEQIAARLKAEYDLRLSGDPAMVTAAVTERTTPRSVSRISETIRAQSQPQ